MFIYITVYFYLQCCPITTQCIATTNIQREVGAKERWVPKRDERWVLKRDER
jgi:hypothetical protein